jgi:hypothetical protein
MGSLSPRHRAGRLLVVVGGLLIPAQIVAEWLGDGRQRVVFWLVSIGCLVASYAFGVGDGEER